MNTLPFVRTAAAGIFFPFALIYGYMRPGIRILMYHRVSDLPENDQLTVGTDLFDSHMACLSADHRVISLADALSELQRPVTSPGVVITFDDGYRDNFTHALPVLRKYGLPATIFVTSDFCDQSVRHPRYGREQGRLHLDWDEVRALAAEPGITIGSHTLSHPFLTSCPEEQAWEEIVESRARISGKVGRDIDFFCYPAGDYGPREVDFVRAAGYLAAVTVAPGQNRNPAAYWELLRTEITYKDRMPEFRAKLAGAFDPVHAFLYQRRRSGKKQQDGGV